MSGGEFVEFSAEQRAEAAVVADLRRRLVRLGAGKVDMGRCEHGWVAGCDVQRGRAHVEFVAHGLGSPLEALEDLVVQIERAKRGR